MLSGTIKDIMQIQYGQSSHLGLIRIRKLRLAQAVNRSNHFDLGVSYFQINFAITHYIYKLYQRVINTIFLQNKRSNTRKRK